jgi:hypothetical protein
MKSVSLFWLLAVLIVIEGFYFIKAGWKFEEYAGPLLFSLLFSAIFLLSLYLMDRMTALANGESKKRLIEDLKRLRKELSTSEAIAQAEVQVVSLSSEPVGVLDKREIRRALAISVTIAYFAVLAFAMFGKLENTEVISSFSKVFLVVIAFYFGSRAVEDAIKLYRGQSAQKAAQSAQAQPQAEKKENKEMDRSEGG